MTHILRHTHRLWGMGSIRLPTLSSRARQYACAEGCYCLAGGRLPSTLHCSISCSTTDSCIHVALSDQVVIQTSPPATQTSPPSLALPSLVASTTFGAAMVPVYLGNGNTFVIVSQGPNLCLYCTVGRPARPMYNTETQYTGLSRQTRDQQPLQEHVGVCVAGPSTVARPASTGPKPKHKCTGMMLQAGEDVVPQSAFGHSAYTLTLSLASPTCNDDDDDDV